MNHSAHADHGPASDAHAGHKMSALHEAHDRHAGHSVAMFRLRQRHDGHCHEYEQGRGRPSDSYADSCLNVRNTCGTRSAGRRRQYYVSGAQPALRFDARPSRTSGRSSWRAGLRFPPRSVPTVPLVVRALPVVSQHLDDIDRPGHEHSPRSCSRQRRNAQVPVIP
jgi:hypothetical protein